MNENLSVLIKYTPEDLIRVWKDSAGVKIGDKTGIVVCASVFLLILTLFAYQFQEEKILLFGIVPAIGLGAALFRVYKILASLSLKRDAVRYLNSHPDFQEEVRVTFSDEGIEKKYGFSKDLKMWEAYSKATETETEFFFHTDDTLSEFLPKRVFASEFEQARLRELVTRKLGAKAEF